MNDFTTREKEILSALKGERVRLIKFTGSTESLEEMKKNLGDEIINVYENDNGFIVETCSGIRYFPSAHYIVRGKDE